MGENYPRLRQIWADQGYTGTLVRWAAEEYGLTVQVVYPEDRQLKRYAPDVLPDLGYAPGFRVIPRRWVVERTISWLKGLRRMRVRYDRLGVIQDAWTSLAASVICFRLLHEPAA